MKWPEKGECLANPPHLSLGVTESGEGWGNGVLAEILIVLSLFLVGGGEGNRGAEEL